MFSDIILSMTLHTTEVSDIGLVDGIRLASLLEDRCDYSFFPLGSVPLSIHFVYIIASGVVSSFANC